MPHGLRHHHERQRALKGMPRINTRLARAIDFIVYPVGVASLLFGLPQVYEVVVLGNIVGISMLTWGAWAVFNVFWILYGVVHKAPALVFLNVGWFLLNTTVALGVFLKS